MKKINGGYKSLFEYLVYREIKKDNSGLFRWIQKTFYRNEIDNERLNETPQGKKLDQLIGSFQAYADMAHDAQYTFKRYRSFRDFLVDLFQPLRGLRNILQGLTIWVGTLIYGAGAVISDLFRWNFEELKKDLVNIVSWLNDGGARIVRGLTQIFATPFTWFLKMPLRTVKTLVKGTPDILENEDIRRLVALSDNKQDVGSLHLIQMKLMAEYTKHRVRGQKSTRLVELPNYDYEYNVLSSRISNIRNYIKYFNINAPTDSTDTPWSYGSQIYGGQVNFPDM